MCSFSFIISSMITLSAVIDARLRTQPVAPLRGLWLAPKLPPKACLRQLLCSRALSPLRLIKLELTRCCVPYGSFAFGKISNALRLFSSSVWFILVVQRTQKLPMASFGVVNKAPERSILPYNIGVVLPNFSLGFKLEHTTLLNRLT